MRVVLFCLPFAGVIVLVWIAYGFVDAIAAFIFFAVIAGLVLGQWWWAGALLR